ncbi:class I SAM-dependent methyltransferase [Paraburkholderia sp. PREW-6R]|uniref:class I SAM-dependent methyltransferase n=1 Tax=Paraburkholderia sp. PREW-6R TaxID=3141544 RepID=UPI0031F517C5
MIIPDRYEDWLAQRERQRLQLLAEHEIWEQLESAAQSGEPALFAALRDLPVDTVGALLMDIPARYPLLRRYLPSMASNEVQEFWTGSHGLDLLLQTCGFVRSVRDGFLQYTGRRLSNLPTLDYGCGWGRILRVMLSLVGPENLFGCDPWHKSLEACDGHHIRANIALSDYLPTSLPFPGQQFSLIYAFSVFTHLSERAADAALAACRRHVAPDGLMVVTVRPGAYWDKHAAVFGLPDMEQQKHDHATRGFAFLPHDREAVDGEITYGDTSISPDYIRERWTDWELAGIDRLLQDPTQTIVFLKPR